MPDITISRTRLTPPRYLFCTDPLPDMPPTEDDLKLNGKWKSSYNGLGIHIPRPTLSRRTVVFTEVTIKKIEGMYFDLYMSIERIARELKTSERRITAVIKKASSPNRKKRTIYVRASFN